jgi:hypothetical protein
VKNFEKIYFLKLKMSLELYSLIPGQQVKRDRDLSNVTIQCDPLAVYPDNRTAAGVATAGNRFKPGEAGKLAVEDEICDLTINGNLEVKGKLKVSAFPAEICNIFCPEDFNLRANSSILQDAGDTFVVTAEQQVSVVTTATGSAPVGNIIIGASGGLTLGSETSSRETAIRAGNIISIGSAAGNSQGIHMNFGDTNTDNLKMTNANVDSSGPANAQFVTANAVTGTIRLLNNTQIDALGGITDVISCTLTNDKITTSSTVLYSVNIAGSNSERISINGGGTTAGSLVFYLANFGTGNYISGGTDRIVISFLVINPV